ncbi:DUF262 domain-containing HNH endonuclease family protein [Hymenobacter sp. GOD-10R]|uniref:DUF262 domain-containing protein n=1 Tax=Hymenobacter sp. GOD-10R TaxID=3093922 RepID=UPI002D77DFC1|nr:DUF262 domain-containing HNH endonuclease family protein [Hymenobacter sp. GOD-10R]WRQ27966.1 DUF262 domain-containing HNH endonuclease family protein [Hymenobacter sp. GOD-10R]
MSKPFTPHAKGIAELFTKSERKRLVVPAFQRGFSWEKQQIGAFWEDTIAFGKEYQQAPTAATYFLGSIVVTSGEEDIKILDGQQRLATITMLLCAIRNKARSLQNDKGHNLARDIHRDYITKENEDENEENIIYSLTLGELDGEYFRRTIQSDPPLHVEVQLKSHKLIHDGNKLINDYVGQLIDSLTKEEAIKKLSSLKNWCTKGMQMVSIEVSNDEDAYHIFETLNDRGMSLSTVDLLINLLLQKANSAQRPHIRQSWNEIIENFGRKDINRFLRHVWISEFGDLKNKTLYKALKLYIEENKVSSQEFSDRCLSDSTTYINLLDQKDIPEGSISNVYGITKALGMGYTLPILLSAKRHLSDKNFIKITNTLSTICTRTYIINYNPTIVEEILYESAKKLTTLGREGKNESQILSQVNDYLSALNISDDAVLSSLQNESSISVNNTAALWILKNIINKQQSITGEFAVSNSNVEHIFPQKPTVDSWNNISELKPYTYHFGNLTVLQAKLNDAAANSSFKNKRDNYYKKSEIIISKSIVNYTEWTKDAILQRAQELGQLLNSTFNNSAKSIKQMVKKSDITKTEKLKTAKTS